MNTEEQELLEATALIIGSVLENDEIQLQNARMYAAQVLAQIDCVLIGLESLIDNGG